MYRRNSHARTSAGTMVLVVLTALLGAILGPGRAQAATEVFRQNYKDATVYGYSSSYDGCLYTYVSVSASQPKGLPASVYYSEDSYNWCTYESFYRWGSAEPSDYRVGPRLDSASVTATIPLSDGTVFVLDEVFTATGPLSKTRYSYSSSGEGYRYTSRYTGEWRPAVGTGTVDLTYASIANVKSGYLSMTKS